MWKDTGILGVSIPATLSHMSYKVNLLVLSIPKFPKGVPSFSTISSKDIHVAIKTKQELSTVVIRSRFLNLEN